MVDFHVERTAENGENGIVRRGQNRYEVVGYLRRRFDTDHIGWPGQLDKENLFHVVLLPRTDRSKVATVTESVLMGLARWKQEDPREGR
jgi:hypothetical protein